MEILVTWLQSNYPAFARAAKSHQGHKLLLKLLRKMESSGHSGYTTDKIRSQINNLKCHATGQYSIRSLSSYNMRLREIFAQEQTSASGSSCEHLEQNDVSSSDSEAPNKVKMVAMGRKGMAFTPIRWASRPRVVYRRRKWLTERASSWNLWAHDRTQLNWIETTTSKLKIRKCVASALPVVSE